MFKPEFFKLKVWILSKDSVDDSLLLVRERCIEDSRLERDPPSISLDRLLCLPFAVVVGMSLASESRERRSLVKPSCDVVEDWLEEQEERGRLNAAFACWLVAPSLCKNLCVEIELLLTFDVVSIRVIGGLR